MEDNALSERKPSVHIQNSDPFATSLKSPGLFSRLVSITATPVLAPL